MIKRKLIKLASFVRWRAGPAAPIGRMRAWRRSRARVNLLICRQLGGAPEVGQPLAQMLAGRRRLFMAPHWSGRPPDGQVQFVQSVGRPIGPIGRRPATKSHEPGSSLIDRFGLSRVTSGAGAARAWRAQRYLAAAGRAPAPGRLRAPPTGATDGRQFNSIESNWRLDSCARVPNEWAPIVAAHCVRAPRERPFEYWPARQGAPKWNNIVSCARRPQDWAGRPAKGICACVGA